MGNLARKAANFKRALTKLKEASTELRERNNNEIVRDGLIQRFEFTYELAWKATKEYLENMGIVEINSPKAVFKEAYAQKLVEDELIWLTLIKDRNETTHVYNEERSIEIAERIVNQYIGAFDKLLTKVEQ